MKSWMQRAREASELTPAECAQALFLSVDDYLTRENNPGMLTVDELSALGPLFSGAARTIVVEGIKASLA